MFQNRLILISKYVSALIVFTILSCYLTYPLLLHMGSISTGYGDEFVISWILNWVIHSLTTNPQTIWNTNTYFPYHNTWAYSDLLITSGIMAMIPYFLNGQPIIAFNFTVISSFILLGFSLFLLSYYVTNDYFAALFCGILVIFSPALIQYNVHVQMLACEWIPLSVLSFLIFIKSKKSRYLTVSMVFFLMQTYNSLLPGYFLVFFYAVFVLYFYFFNRSILSVFSQKVNLVIIGLTIAAVIPILIPYYQVSHEFNYVRPFKDTIHFALQPEDFLYSNEYTRFEPILLDWSNSHHYHAISGELKAGFLGLIFTLCSIFALFYLMKKWKRNKPMFSIFMFTGILGLILSLGPFLHFNRVTIHHPFPIPLPYAVFYFILPGFQAFRDTERWEILFVICTGVGISIVLSELFKKINTYAKATLFILLSIGVILEFNFPIPYQPVTQRKSFPPLFQWLAKTPPNTSIIILPIYNWNTQESSIEMRREYYSTIEFRPMVNGYSGFSPPPWQQLIATLQTNFPNKNSIKEIHSLGVTEIVIDEKQFNYDYSHHLGRVNADMVISELGKNKSLRLYKNLGSFVIYSFKISTNK